MTPEGQIVADIRRYLRRCGCWEIKTWGGPMQRAGVPDILCCVPPHGQLVAIEAKVPGRKPTSDQVAELAAIRAVGGVAVLAHGLPDVVAVVDPLLPADRPRQTSLALIGERTE